MPGALDKARPTLAALPPLGRARQVARALSDYIEAAGLGPGDRLPPERDLTQSLRVGRSSLREAVSQLQALGVLEARIGSGTYVLKSVSGRTVHLPLSIEAHGPGDALLLTLEVRRGIEIEASMAAARRRTPGDLERIASSARHDGDHASSRGDRGRGRLGLSPRDIPCQRQPIVQASAGAAARSCSSSSGASRSAAPDFAARSFPFHRQLYEAIRDGDPAAAAAHTRAILDIVEEDIRDMSR